jgi:flavin-binding protein dodecin
MRRYWRFASHRNVDFSERVGPGNASRLKRRAAASDSGNCPQDGSLKEETMPDKTYKIVDVVGVSEESIHHAVRNALTKASQTLRNIDWFEVKNIRGAVHKDGAPEFQVEVRIGFRLEGSPVN